MLFFVHKPNIKKEWRKPFFFYWNNYFLSQAQTVAVTPEMIATNGAA